MFSFYNAVFWGIAFVGIILTIIGIFKKKFLLTSLGVNIMIVPVSLFIGIMATDAPSSNFFDFLLGFLFIQGMPIILLIVSVLKSFCKNKAVS